MITTHDALSALQARRRAKRKYRQRALQKSGGFDSVGWPREDDSPMSRRDLSQPSFVDAMVSGYGKVGGFLERIEQGFDWPAFEALLSPIHGSAPGAPGYPPLTMFKILLLQQWRTLSDPGAEEAVRDRLLFRRFCGLPLDVETPDHASIRRFRQTIDRLGLSVGLLTEVNWRLDALGLISTAHRRVHHRRRGQAPRRARRHQSARPRGSFHRQAR